MRERKQTFLLTGDGHGSDILKGLKFHRLLDGQGRIHVNVLKVQHHGSEHNIDEEFVSRVSADHYVFCANGEHANPDLRVVELICASRLDRAPFQATHPHATGPFKFWFNSSASAPKKIDAQQHMRRVQELVADRIAASAGRLSAEFLEGSTPSFELVI